MNGNTTGILKMKQQFLFDVDGTLTPSRGRINEDFRLFMVDFAERYDCYLVTGSDQPKTIEQLGQYLYNKFIFQFQCSGNEVYGGHDFLRYKSDWKLDKLHRLFLEEELWKSEFTLRTGRHIEERTGTVNFSIVGRNATMKERTLYIQWDQTTNERRDIASRFNEQFPYLEATIGGETGIDISPKGKDKSQIIDHLWREEIYFFGDACEEGGNDYPLAKVIMEKNLGIVYNVKDYKETWNKLKEIDYAISSIR